MIAAASRWETGINDTDLIACVLRTEFFGIKRVVQSVTGDQMTKPLRRSFAEHQPTFEEDKVHQDVVSSTYIDNQPQLLYNTSTDSLSPLVAFSLRFLAPQTLETHHDSTQ